MVVLNAAHVATAIQRVYSELAGFVRQRISKRSVYPASKSGVADGNGSSYWHMREIENEALQRLYWACRKGSNFPGLLPDETDGAVTTHAILRGLGLIGPEEDEFVLQELLKRPSTYDDKQGKPRQPTPPSSPQSASPSDDSRGSSSRSNSFDMQICDLPEQMLHNFTPAAGSPIGVTVSPPQRLQSQSLGANQRAVYTAVPTQPLPAPVPLNTNMMASQFFDFESASATGLDELFYQDLMQWPVAPNSGVFPMQG